MMLDLSPLEKKRLRSNVAEILSHIDTLRGFTYKRNPGDTWPRQRLHDIIISLASLGVSVPGTVRQMVTDAGDGYPIPLPDEEYEKAKHWLEQLQSGIDETKAKTMTWKEAAQRMLEMFRRGDTWSSQPQMARLIVCSPATINKAIQNTPSLQTWAKHDSAAPISAITLIGTDEKQSNEVKPEDELAIKEFLETEQDEKVKTWFLSLSTAAQIEHLDDIARTKDEERTGRGKGLKLRYRKL